MAVDRIHRSFLFDFVFAVVPSTNVFSIDNSGKLTATGVLDRENISSYSLVIKVGNKVTLLKFILFMFAKVKN